MAASDKVIAAARNLLAAKCATIKAGNGRDVGVEMEDGEKGYIIHSDHIFALEFAVADYDKRRAEMKRTASEATGG